MTRLRVVRGDTPRLEFESEGLSSTVKPFKVDVMGWLWYAEETLVVLLLPPSLNRELFLLDWDFGERFGFEE